MPWHDGLDDERDYGHAEVSLRAEVSLTKSSREFICALAGLMAAIDHADPALLEDRIVEAHARLHSVLAGDAPQIRFEEASDDG